APDLWPAADGTLTPAREGCDVGDGPALAGGRWVVGVTDPVQPRHAPVPRNAGERLVFAQLYETLVNVGCDGEARPGLASTWACTEDSTTWVFTLRPDARFWDGTPVTAPRVRDAWLHNAGGDDDPSPASPWRWISARANSISAVDARRLAIRLPEPHARFPQLLAHPAAAVALRQPGWTWPVGSGPARLRASDPAPRPDLGCRPNLNHPDAPTWDELVFHVRPGLDPRDLVGDGIDLLELRDRENVAFFDQVPAWAVHPLPWDRQYVLVCPPDMRDDGPDPWAAAVAGLVPARDVTAVSARDWPHVDFPRGGAVCPQLSGPIPAPDAAPLASDLGRGRLGPRTIAYPAGDAAAAELAGRLGHLAGTSVRIAGLAAVDYDLALEWQMSGAFVLPLDQLFPTGCLQLATLMGRAAWLQKAGLDRPEARAGDSLAAADRDAAWRAPDPAAVLAAAGVVHPLAVTRSWLAARGEIAGLRLDFDGTPLLAGLGRPDPAPHPTAAGATP
ncbi:hypothetical protein KDM41_15575, partial [bacterium]|nr:hypothetical protein [bacterium]